MASLVMLRLPLGFKSPLPQPISPGLVEKPGAWAPVGGWRGTSEGALAPCVL